MGCVGTDVFVVGGPEEQGAGEAEGAKDAEEEHHALVTDGIEGGRGGDVVQPADDEVGTSDAGILDDKHQAEGGAASVRGI